VISAVIPTNEEKMIALDAIHLGKINASRIWRIVVLNKVTDINFFFPVRTVKSVPCFGVQHIAPPRAG
jgi:hypothetical protein